MYMYLAAELVLLGRGIVDRRLHSQLYKTGGGEKQIHENGRVVRLRDNMRKI
jgi:hypothetical protein